MPVLAVAWESDVARARSGRSSDGISRGMPGSPGARFAGRAASMAKQGVAPCVAVVHAEHGMVLSVMECSTGVHPSGI